MSASRTNGTPGHSHGIVNSAPAAVLLVSPDVLPLPGLRTTGAGLRAWGLGQGLRARGHQVTFAMPRCTTAACGYDGRGDALVFDEARLDELIEQLTPDLVVFQHWPMVHRVTRSRVPIAIDLHGPLLLETLYHSGRRATELYQSKLEAFSRADFFTCAGERQRNYFYAWISMAGFDLRKLPIEVIPFSHSPQLPDHEYPTEPTFVYGGVCLPWQDPSLGLNVLLNELEQAGKGRLDFYGGKHPWLDISATDFDAVLKRIDHSPRATVCGPQSHATLIERYRQSSVAWDVMTHNCERGMAVTSRTVEYLWAGLPVVHQNFAELSERIARFEAGWLVDPQDAEQIARVAREILANPDEVARRGRNAQRLVREELTWDVTIAPLDRFARSPSRALRFEDRPIVGEAHPPVTLRHWIQPFKARVARIPVGGYVAKKVWSGARRGARLLRGADNPRSNSAA